jgi:hypothetical protein
LPKLADHRRVDVKDLKTYQQLYIYFIPILTNLGFINILVVVVRLHWFEKRLKEAGTLSALIATKLTYLILSHHAAAGKE